MHAGSYLFSRGTTSENAYKKLREAEFFVVLYFALVCAFCVLISLS